MPPYPPKLINEGETLVLDLKPHWWFFWKYIVAIGILVYAGFVVEKYFAWTYTHFVLTDRRVISRSGIVSKRGTEIPLDRINNIDFHQRIWERVIGAGDLDIESAGKDGQSHFENVRHPDMVQQEIYRQMEVNARRQASWHADASIAARPAPAAAVPVATPDVADQIAKLATLRDQGAITTEEFEAKKAELLDRM